MPRLFVLFIILINPFITNAQVYIISQSTGGDQTIYLQKILNDKNVNTLVFDTPTFLVNGEVNVPKNKELRFENGSMLSGHGVINGGIIEADYHSQIFDSSITINPQAVNQYFSVKWFGAKGDRSFNDHNSIQQAINTCIKNNIRTVFFPTGTYKIDEPLIERALPSSNRFFTLELLGESSFWDSNQGSEILTSFKDAFAIGIQLGKGCKIRKLKFTGLFKVPQFANTKDFYNASFEKFIDPQCRDNRYSPYAAIVIDPFSHGSESTLPEGSQYPKLQQYYGNKINDGEIRGGSTGTELEELNITNFVVGICSSPNGITQNAEITLINKIQFANCKLCISAGQAQEKANTISNIYCWGGTHTIFATGLYGKIREAGNWNIDHVNIAGGVVRFIDNDQHGYFPTYISHVFAESLGSWGTINSEIACEILDCMIDFAYKNEASEQTLLTSWGKLITYRSCNFRYYGEKTPLHFEGNATFENCFFSGPVKTSNSIMGVPLKFPSLNNKILFIITAFISLIIISVVLKKRFYFKPTIQKTH